MSLTQALGFQAWQVDAALGRQQVRHFKAAGPQLHIAANRLSINAYRHPVSLPWSEECLPLFCRIEHRMGRRSTVPFKFRLGSVEYVDWLEGKQPAP